MAPTLFAYECTICHTKFNDPVDEKCPECGSFKWGDKRPYYAKLRVISDEKKQKKTIIQEKLKESEEKGGKNVQSGQPRAHA